MTENVRERPQSNKTEQTSHINRTLTGILSSFVLMNLIVVFLGPIWRCIHVVWEEGSCVFASVGLQPVCCSLYLLLTLSLGVIDRLCFLIVALTGHSFLPYSRLSLSRNPRDSYETLRDIRTSTYQICGTE